MTAAIAFLFGALTMGFLVAAMFFYRFWRESRDRLFLWFSGAFILLGLQRCAAVIASRWLEDATWLYGLRLLAFVVILAAILDKNRGPRRS